MTEAHVKCHGVGAQASRYRQRIPWSWKCLLGKGYAAAREHKE